MEHQQQKSIRKNAACKREHSNASIITQSSTLALNQQHLHMNQTHRQVNELQHELSTCIGTISTESKKNTMYQQLIALLTSQINQWQDIQQQEVEQSYMNYHKKVQKAEYDIKQILHKHNEQVAKINTLKEQASASRSERVVLSNLFKKIEKEIKQNQQQYTQLLIKNQTYLHQRKVQQQPQPIQLSGEQQCNNSINNIVNVPIFQLHSPVKVLESKIASKTNIVVDEEHKQIVDGIKQKQYLIDRVITQTQAQSLREVIELHENVKKQNQALSSIVDSMSDEIQGIETSIRQLRNTRKEMGIVESECGEETLVGSVGNGQSDLDIFNSVCEELQINKCGEHLYNTFMRVDERINQIFRDKRDSLGFIEGKGVEEILDKVEKVKECERIFDRQAFKQEYHKEVTKIRNKHRGKKYI